MIKPCHIKINGMCINSLAQEALQYNFEAKKSEISSIARDEFDEAENDDDIENIKMVLESFSPERLIYPETEFTTYGVIDKKDDHINITFDDGIGEAFGKGLTTFCIFGEDTISLIKHKGGHDCLTFRNGKRMMCDYNERLNSPVTLYSRTVDCDITENGGTIDLDYFVEVSGTVCEHNKFNITVRA